MRTGMQTNAERILAELSDVWDAGFLVACEEEPAVREAFLAERAQARRADELYKFIASVDMTKSMINTLGADKAIAWIAGMVDAGRAVGTTYTCKALKVREPVFCDWVDGKFIGVITVQTLMSDASSHKETEEHVHWQVRMLIDPERPKYITVTTATRCKELVIARLMGVMSFFDSKVAGIPMTLIDSSTHLIPYMRTDPPYYYTAGKIKKIVGHPEGTRTALTVDEKQKVLQVISSAYSILQGTGGIRMNAMAALSNFFNVAIPEEAKTEIMKEETEAREAMAAAAAAAAETGGSSSSGGADASMGGFIILEPSELVGPGGGGRLKKEPTEE
jgi:hypothetical protein